MLAKLVYDQADTCWVYDKAHRNWRGFRSNAIRSHRTNERLLDCISMHRFVYATKLGFYMLLLYLEMTLETNL